MIFNKFKWLKIWPILISIGLLFTGCALDPTIDGPKILVEKQITPEVKKKPEIKVPSAYEKEQIRKYLNKDKSTPKTIASPDKSIDTESLIKSKMVATAQIWSGKGYGSGFYVGNNGLLITAAHVVEHSKSKIVTIEHIDGTKHQGEVIKINNKLDLAIIRSYKKPKMWLNLAKDKIYSGNPAFLIGAGGMKPIHITKLEYLGHIYPNVLHGKRYYGGIYTPGIEPGDSGGAVLNSEGDVVGVGCYRTPHTLCVDLEDLKAFIKWVRYEK